MVYERINLLIAIVVFAVIIRLYLCWISEGITHPDELYQYMEPAFGLNFGYWIKAWEFTTGFRSYFYPLINALIFKTGISLGIRDICLLILGGRLFNGLLSSIMVLIVYLTAKFAYNRDVGLYATFMTAFSSIILTWTPRTMSELPSTFFLTLSVYLFITAVGNNRGSGADIKVFLSGLSLGVSFMFRPSSAMALLPLIIYLISKRKLKKTVYLGISFVSILMAQGFIDQIIYGRFLSSFISWIIFSIEGGPSQWGTAPFVYYLVLSPYIYSPVGLILLGSMITSMFHHFKGNDCDWIITSMFLFLFVGHSCVPHKEIRFLLPTAPLAFLLAARRFEQISRPVKNKKRKVRFIAFTLSSFLVTNMLVISLIDWMPYGEQTRAVYWIGEQPDLQGMICECPWWLSGVYTYLHTNVPVYFVDDLTTFSRNRTTEFLGVIQNQTYNYVLTKNEKGFLNNYGFVKVNNFGDTYVYKRN